MVLTDAGRWLADNPPFDCQTLLHSSHPFTVHHIAYAYLLSMRPSHCPHTGAAHTSATSLLPLPTLQPFPAPLAYSITDPASCCQFAATLHCAAHILFPLFCYFYKCKDRFENVIIANAYQGLLAKYLACWRHNLNV